MDFQYILGSIGNAAPFLAIWIVAVVFSSVFMRRHPRTPELFLVIGSSLMLVGYLVSASGDAVVNHLARNGSASVGETAAFFIRAQALTSLAGTICLFYAVWKKFSESISRVADSQKQGGTSNPASN